MFFQLFLGVNYHCFNDFKNRIKVLKWRYKTYRLEDGFWVYSSFDGSKKYYFNEDISGSLKVFDYLTKSFFSYLLYTPKALYDLQDNFLKQSSLEITDNKVTISGVPSSFEKKCFLSANVFFNFFILHCYAYSFSPWNQRKNILIFSSFLHIFVNSFIKMIQENRDSFVRKVYCFEHNQYEVEKDSEGKNFFSVSDIQKKKDLYKRDIFFQDFFVVPIVNECSLSFYRAKYHKMNRLICPLGYLLLALANHMFLYQLLSFLWKGNLKKRVLCQLPFLCLSSFNLFCCMKDILSKKYN
jgi:hypothetical protein